MGQDFFEYQPSMFDLVISNPPFSRKLDVYKRLNQLKRPWAMIGNIFQLNYMEIGNYFADNSCQLIIPDKRISFDGNPSSFCSGYFCKDFLLNDLNFIHTKNCNSGNNFIPSRMYKR
jgi:methylase of polypeptide subunit release factors